MTIIKLCSSNRYLVPLSKILAFNNKQFLNSSKHLCLNNFRSLNFNSLLTLNSINFKREYMDLGSVIKIFEEKIPNYLSESWDNTGLLIEPSRDKKVCTVFFTNDLTEAVLEEALSQKSDLIISYHPPIFSSIKSLRQSSWKDRIVIKCIENSVAVYSPHTSCDAVSGGVNDWLINCFNLSESQPIHPSYECQPKYSHVVEFFASDGEIADLIQSVPDCQILSKSLARSKHSYRVGVNKAYLNNLLKFLKSAEYAESISVTDLSPLPIPLCGMGRIGKLAEPLTLGECIKLVKNYLKLDFIRFSQSTSHSLDAPISTVAVCAGSGSSVLKGVSADLYVTGEMSHHDLLDANHKSISVILCEHSNSERGYLRHLTEALKPKLPDINLIISSCDKDPVTIV